MKQWDAKLSRKVLHTVITVVITLAVFGGGMFAYLFFKQDTQTSLTDNPGKQLVSTVKATNAADAHFTEADFSFNLPSDWKKTGELSTSSMHEFNYQATQKDADNRFLHVFMDQLPASMAVNKEVAVRPDGDKLSHGEISGMCTDFTNQTTPKSHQLQAKWDGVDFLCDMDGVASNVAGAGAPGAINKITLIGPETGKHDFFFVYEDDNYNPDYGIFYNFLDSFSVK